jgi:thiosulfate reductase cytochrome b subunit
MKAATERKIIRWLHIILSIPILGYIYGPVATNPPAANAVRWVILPVVILSGLWMWKGHLLKKKLRGTEKKLFT